MTDIRRKPTATISTAYEVVIPLYPADDTTTWGELRDAVKYAEKFGLRDTDLVVWRLEEQSNDITGLIIRAE